MGETKGVVYQIRNIVTAEIYIGSTIHFGARKSSHLALLRNRKHYNRRLQSAWNLHGEQSFTIEPIHETEDINGLYSLEKDYIQRLKPVYNLLPYASLRKSRFLAEATKNKLRKSSSGRRHTPEAIEKMRQYRGAVKITRGMLGKHPSEAARQKMRMAKLGKPSNRRSLTPEQEETILAQLRDGGVGKELAQVYGISYKVIQRLKKRSGMKMRKGGFNAG